MAEPYRGPIWGPTSLKKNNADIRFAVVSHIAVLGKKKKHRHSIRCGLVFLMVLLPLFIPH